MSNIERNFTLNPVFTGISKLNANGQFSVKENHYGHTWSLNIRRYEDDFGAYLYFYPKQKKRCKVTAGFIIELASPTGEKEKQDEVESHDFESDYNSIWGFPEFVEWPELIEKYVKDDKIEVKCHVTITKVTGLDKKPLVDFDESMKKYSDVVIKVGDQEFYVSKLTLARHSPYFEAMFLGNFEEATKSEVELKGVDPQDFQDYLELFHFESPLSDLNVEKLLEFAEMYDTPAVIKKCAEHLMNERCKLSRRDKIRLASRFNLESLMDECVGECKTVKDLHDMMPDDVSGLKMRVVQKVLDKVFEKIPMESKLL